MKSQLCLHCCGCLGLQKHGSPQWHRESTEQSNDMSIAWLHHHLEAPHWPDSWMCNWMYDTIEHSSYSTGEITLTEGADIRVKLFELRASTANWITRKLQWNFKGHTNEFWVVWGHILRGTFWCVCWPWKGRFTHQSARSLQVHERLKTSVAMESQNTLVLWHAVPQMLSTRRCTVYNIRWERERVSMFSWPLQTHWTPSWLPFQDLPHCQGRQCRPLLCPRPSVAASSLSACLSCTPETPLPVHERTFTFALTWTLNTQTLHGGHGGHVRSHTAIQTTGDYVDEMNAIAVCVVDVSRSRADHE